MPRKVIIVADPGIDTAFAVALALNDPNLEVIGLLPSLSAQECAVIELYMVAPVAAAERDGLIQQMLAHIRSAEDKQIALQAVDAMLNADGVVSPEEAAIRQHVHAAITAVNVSPLGRLRNAVGSVVQPPPAREQGLELWRTNPIFYILHMQSARPGSAQLEVAALAAGIMAQVVRITPAAGAAEFMVARGIEHDDARGQRQRPQFVEQIVKTECFVGDLTVVADDGVDGNEKVLTPRLRTMA